MPISLKNLHYIFEILPLVEYINGITSMDGCFEGLGDPARVKTFVSRKIIIGCLVYDSEGPILLFKILMKDQLPTLLEF
ncbi:Protein of unknown function D [Prunus dulcis]|uniref:Uncharacterized protein n=1 Tax=Prunus dulcis TaxID=3755 RepID=A0A4Y1S1I6_PRUDU|nr:Protein of unknown function D [Prunus dulcis]